MSKEEFWKRISQILASMFVGLTLALFLILPGCNRRDDDPEQSEEAQYSESNSKCVFVGEGLTKRENHKRKGYTTYRKYLRYYCLEKSICYFRWEDSRREESGSIVLPVESCREVELF